MLMPCCGDVLLGHPNHYPIRVLRDLECEVKPARWRSGIHQHHNHIWALTRWALNEHIAGEFLVRAHWIKE